MPHSDTETIKPLTEEMAQCARCGSTMDHPRCDGCGGDGFTVHEDDEGYEIEEECGQCGGDGSWACCLSSTEWCEANPLPGREAVARHTVEWFEVPL